MAVQVFKSAIVKMGSSASPSTYLAKYVRSVTLNYRVEILDKTAMGSSGRRRTIGLKDASLAIEMNNDYSTGAATNKSVDGFINSLYGASSTACFIYVRASSGAIGASNPAYVGSYILESYNPVSGGVGDLGVVAASFVADGAVRRIVA